MHAVGIFILSVIAAFFVIGWTINMVRMLWPEEKFIVILTLLTITGVVLALI